MDETGRAVLDGFRAKLTGPRRSPTFLNDLEGRVRQLGADMVDGRLLAKPEAEELRAAVMDFVRSEALPKLRAKRPNDAIVVLDKLKAYGWTALEGERPRLERERASKHPPPAAATWSELQELKSAGEDYPNYCVLDPPVDNLYFAEALREGGLPLPDELLALYAACDGFDLSHIAEPPHVPVFSLLSSRSIDDCEASGGYARRAACFQGGDEVQLSVYRDRKKVWWLVYEYEYQPIAKKPLHVPALLRFGLQRMRATSFEALNGGELSWERYFDVADEKRT